MNWTLQILGAAPCCAWAAGTWLTGNKRIVGWVVLFFSEFLWGVLGWYTRAWTLIFWAGVGLWLYQRNYRKWKRDGTEA